MTAIWYETVPILPQSQESLADQLTKLHTAANRLGLFDAADWLEIATKRRNEVAP